MTNSLFFRIWFLALVVKLGITAWLPLFSDEAYYWVWSKNLQWSYYDHPAMIAWWLKLGEWLEPFGNAVRWPAVIIAHLSFAVWFLILRDQISSERLKWWVGLALLTPMTGAGSMITTPDLPLILFWSLALLCMDRAFKTPDSENTWKWYLGLGVSLGLGFCSKYHMALFLPFMGLWLLGQKRWQHIRWNLVPLTLLAGLVFSSPVFIWNYLNDFASFKFQLNHGLGDKVWKPKYTWRYFYGQIALIFPPVLYFAYRGVQYFRQQKNKAPALSWLPVFSWAPLIFFFLTSFRGKVEANWPSVAYPSIIVLALIGAQSFNWAKWTVRLWATALILVATHIASPWLPFFDHKKLKTYELERYKTSAKVSESYTPFFASSFQMASKIYYQRKEPVFKLYGFGRRDFFDVLEGSKPTTNEYFWAAQRWEHLPIWAKEAGHAVVDSFPLNDDYVLKHVKVFEKAP